MTAAIKGAAIIIESVFLLWFIIPIRFRIFKAGNIAGVMICLAALFRTAFSSVYHGLEAIMTQYTPTAVLWITAHFLCIAFAVYAIVISIIMIIAMKIKPADDATAIILGAQVKPWGASRLLKQRIVAAERFLTAHPGAKAIASGGQGPNEPMSEAECIRQFLIKDGFAEDRIVLEDRSVNTEQNLRYSIALLKENNPGSNIAIVSDSYHQLRARIAARKIDPDIRIGACNTVNTRFGYLVYPSYFVREWIAVPVEIMKKAGRPAKHRRL